MGYTIIIAKMKWQDLHTNKLKYCSSAKFDEHNNKFGKGWSPVSELMNGIKMSILQTIKADLAYHPFIKDDMFEFTFKFLKKGYFYWHRCTIL